MIGGYAPTFTGEVAELPVANAEPLAAELDAFIKVIREGSVPAISAVDGLWAVAMASGLLQAGKDGRPVDMTTLSERLNSA
jgi:predicted dehydrogenase